MSQEVSAIHAALAKAQGEFKPVKLNRTNTFFNSKYADLAACRDAVSDALSSNGLTLTQPIVIEDGRRVLKTILTHADGGQILSEIDLPQVNKVQELGSALTYMRRYLLCSLLGIAGEEDDDGNAAQAADVEPARGAQKQPNGRYELKGEGPAKSMTDLRKQLNALCAEVREIVRDEQYLQGVLTDNRALIDQGRENIPHWWDGKDDWEGMSAIVDAAYKRVQEADKEFTQADYAEVI